MTEPVPPKEHRTRVLYLSPLRALAHDIDKNLREPLAGIAQAAAQIGVDAHLPTIGVRTGDTSPNDRRRLVTTPPDILITTPESLYLMLTSQARKTLSAVRWVIVDEIHSLAATKRGTHLAVSLERLCLRTQVEPQRIALSATQRPLSEVAEFLGGWGGSADGAAGGAAAGAPDPAQPRPVKIVNVGDSKHLDLEVIVPDKDMGNLAGEDSNSIWPAVHQQVLELILSHHSTIIFVNNRRQAERLASRLNELHTHGINRASESDGTAQPDSDLVGAHHGSLSREQRLEIESALKSGTLRAIVSTSSLELGIDMGAVDLVIQIESPNSVASGMQRIGRAGHQVGNLSVGKLFPSHRSDLVETAAIAQRMRAGLIEQTHYPRLPLDVLAQQIVAMVATDDWNAEELLAVLQRAAPYRRLSQAAFESVLDLLSGLYPSQEFAELRPRIVWDRLAGTLRPRQGAGRLAVTNGGTIADRGLYSVFTLGGSRVGELDEEMVYEARVGEAFLLGASSWRIEEITHDRVLVTPAPGVPAKMPFWHGGGPGRPLELGKAVGAFVRETVDALPVALPPGLSLELPAELAPESLPDLAAAETATTAPLEQLLDRLQTDQRLNRCAAINLVLYLDAQRASTGAVPDDRTIVVERFRDELGDWRICVLTPFGSQVHAPWAIAIQSVLERGSSTDPANAADLAEATDPTRSVEILWNDDGIVLRLPDTEPSGPTAPSGPSSTEPEPTEPNPTDPVEIDPAALVSLDPDTITDTIVGYLPSTALFASRFREVAGRALLLPRRRPGERTPLWQQRQRASSLLEVAAKYPSFPMLLETTRECLQDVFDVPALVEVLRDISTATVRVVAVETHTPSPMAQGLVFDWTAAYLYNGDLPLAERRAAALSLNQKLLADLLGPEELRELLDPEVLANLEEDLRRVRAKDADQLHDELQRLGDLTAAEIVERARPSASADVTDQLADQPADQLHDWLAELLAARRICEIEIASEPRLITTEDAARYRGALGCDLPAGLPAALIAPTPDVSSTAHLAELVARFAATHGPFSAQAAADRFGATLGQVEQALAQLEISRRVLAGEFRPGGTQREWCDADVLRALRRRSLARLRNEIKPVPTATYGRFLPTWHGLDHPRAGEHALVDAINMLGGAALVASTLESEVLPARVRNYQPADLDALLSSGELIWVGAGALGARNGRIRLYWRNDFALLAPDPAVIASLAAGSDTSPTANPDASPAEASDIHDALRQVLLTRGSAFWPELLDAVLGTDELVLSCLWDLVWAGEVTNDTLLPLRAMLAGGGASKNSGRGGGQRGGRGGGQRGGSTNRQARQSQFRRGPSFAGQPAQRRSRLRLSRRDLTARATLPAKSTGRWSATAPLYLPRPPAEARAHHNSAALLDRHGVLTRSGVLAEQQPGGFASVYALMRALEERGDVRRGYFIDELGGAQFASTPAIELLRNSKKNPGAQSVLVLATTDPAQPYGAALRWPASAGRPTRGAGSLVVLADGVPLVQLDRGATGIQTFESSRDARWIEALQQRLRDGRLRSVELSKIDGQPAREHPLHDWLLENGFVSAYRGPTLQA